MKIISGLSNFGYSELISRIMSESGYNNEDNPVKSSGKRSDISKFSSDAHRGHIFCRHNCSKWGIQENYGITYIGVKKEKIHEIEYRILDAGFELIA